MVSLAEFLQGNIQSVPLAEESHEDERLPSIPIKGYTVPEKFVSEEPTLIQAVRYNDLQTIERLFRHGEDLNTSRGIECVIENRRLNRSMRLVNFTALHAACVHSEIKTIELLLELGADINARDDNMRTPLHCAASAKRHDVVNLLLSRDVDINAQMSSGKTALMEAVIAPGINIVKSLIANGADVNIKDKKGASVLCQAISRRLNRDGLEMCKVLLKAGADPNHKNSMNGTPLMIATSLKDPQLIELLLDYGADINHMDNGHRTAFQFCIEQNHVEKIARILIRRGADVNSKNSQGKTALDRAVEYGTIPTITFLLRVDSVRDNKLLDNANLQKLCDIYPPFRTTLNKEFLEPWSLMRHCRYTIRNRLFKDNPGRIWDLGEHLPSSLINYLMFV